MTTTADQIAICSSIIDECVELSSDKPDFSAQVIAKFLRDLVEATMLAIICGSNEEMSYKSFKKHQNDPLMKKSEFQFLNNFHNRINISLSHYVNNADVSRRLLQSYLPLLGKVRSIAKEHLQMDILSTLDTFPFNRDPDLLGYYRQILNKVQCTDSVDVSEPKRYYVDSCRLVIVNDTSLYEVAYRNATDYTSKQDRKLAFSTTRIRTNYASKLWIKEDCIEIFGLSFPIDVIISHQISIRPIELTQLSRLMDDRVQMISSNSIEYKNLCRLLTELQLNILDLVLAEEGDFSRYVQMINFGARRTTISDLLTWSRRIILSKEPGHNVLRYLLYKPSNKVLKDQSAIINGKELRGEVHVSSRCFPFGKMPYVCSLVNHNPKIDDLLHCIPAADRAEELLARRIRSHMIEEREIYVPISGFYNSENRNLGKGEVEELVDTFNKRRPDRVSPIGLSNGKLYLADAEKSLESIISRVRAGRVDNDWWLSSVSQWLEKEINSGPNNRLPIGFDDQRKVGYLKELFSKSDFAFVYGEAGTGKSTLINMVAHFFGDANKLFLAHTNPAVDNLKRRVMKKNSQFSTISSYLYKCKKDVSKEKYRLIVVDECSTVDNQMVEDILDQNNFDFILFVGDQYQIESIQFGNWFDCIYDLGKGKRFRPEDFSIFELKGLYRTKEQSLKDLWQSVRDLRTRNNYEADQNEIGDRLTKGNFTQNLNSDFFSSSESSGGFRDEITLCSSYDGIYGINNTNRFLQGVNPNPAVTWNSGVYKIGDPVLFFESSYLGDLVFNNLKGRILGISIVNDGRSITFTIEVERDEWDLDGKVAEMGRHLYGKVIEVTVLKERNTDEGWDDPKDVVPFKVAYAVSIHKAQGLEYDSVRLVITASASESITHNLFYTAITRARKKLTIFWSPDTQTRVLESFNEIAKRTRDTPKILGEKFINSL